MEINAQTTLKNSFYNFIGYAWPIIFSIFITPIVVFRLGTKDYGVFVFINTAISLMGLLDLGIGTSMMKHVAEYSAEKAEEKLKKLICSMNTILLFIGLAGFGGFITLIFVTKQILPEQVMTVYYASAFFVAGLVFFVSSISSIFSIIPNALQQYDISTKIGLVFLTFTNIGNLVIVLSGHGLLAILILQLLSGLVSLIVFSHYSQRLLPVAKLSYGWESTEIKKTYKFGLATFVSGLAGSSLTYLDRLIIPIFLGPTQLTYYSLPANVAMRIPGVANNLTGALFPATVSLEAIKDREKVKRLYMRSSRLILVLSSAIAFSVIFLADKILLYWLSADFADQSTQVLIILAITNLLLALSGLLTNFLLALGRFRFLSTMSLLMAGMNGLLLFILMPRYGINGAAWAYLLSILPTVYMFYHTEKKFLLLTERRRYYASILLKLISATGIFAAFCFFVARPLIENLTTLIIGGPLSVVVYLLIYRYLGFFETEDVTDLEIFSRRIIAKILPTKKTTT